jgi:hypothetical protein
MPGDVLAGSRWSPGILESGILELGVESLRPYNIVGGIANFIEAYSVQAFVLS